jgi:hypothetical protein
MRASPSIARKSNFVEDGGHWRRNRLQSVANHEAHVVKLAYPLCFLLALVCQDLRAQAPTPPQAPPIEPKTALEWFARASDQMNIRLPGSAPFHMKVTFQALPGLEYTRKGEKPEMITGDGVYEETWLAPHQWRREVTLAGYHATEVESDRGRRFQASTDNEPSRVMMLMNALLEPVPRDLSSREYQRDRAAKGWQIDRLTDANTSLVKIERAGFTHNSAKFTDGFCFSPHGLLILRNTYGLQTKWSNGVAFGDKIVPTRITVLAGERTLLVAQLSIAPEGKVSPDEVEIEGGSTDPGMTLRPLQPLEFRNPIPLSADPVWPGANHSALSVSGVVDRSGRYREVELIEGINVGAEEDLVRLMTDFRKSRWRPATIDGYPCQFNLYFLNVKDENQQVGPTGHDSH